MNILPDYMKSCYKALLDTTNEIGWSICEKHGYNPIDSLKRTVRFSRIQQDGLNMLYSVFAYKLC